jgi:hypothetical protein
MDPAVVALLAYRGKKRLRPLPRGAEDAVIGYVSDSCVLVAKAA